jgi:hypothetical protein
MSLEKAVEAVSNVITDGVRTLQRALSVNEQATSDPKFLSDRALKIEAVKNALSCLEMPSHALANALSSGKESAAAPKGPAPAA